MAIISFKTIGATAPSGAFATSFIQVYIHIYICMSHIDKYMYIYTYKTFCE